MIINDVMLLCTHEKIVNKQAGQIQCIFAHISCSSG